MRLVMAGLDYTTAGVAIRDAFAPDAARQRTLLRSLLGGDITGCALIATCNRTELYISHRSDVPPDGMELLCRALGKDPKAYRKHFAERGERQAVEHLMRVAAGMRSSLPADDQILTQVRQAIETARECETADPLLEALFRSAVAAGKQVKSDARLSRNNGSIAHCTITALEQQLGTLSGKQALVIGNGTIGHLVAAGLLAKGCAVSITLRDPRRKASLPPGCAPVDYQDRYAALTPCDLVVSATSSPHPTLTADQLAKAASLPRLFVDLAIPRDIEPAVGDLDNVTLLNVDDLRPDDAGAHEHEQWLAKADGIVQEEAGRFDLWRRNRLRHTRTGDGEPDFPLFVNLRGATVLIAGGGGVAARRAEKLLGFGARVHLVAPAIAPETEKLLGRDGLRWTQEEYRPAHMDGVTLAIAATDQREVNRQIGLDARERGVLVSVADRRRECTFYFPAIVRSDCFTVGLVSNNGDHAMVKRAATRLREEMEAIDANCQSGEPREPSGHSASQPGHECNTPAAP